MIKCCLAVLIASLGLVVNGLHFYMQTDQVKCFIEELPSETLVLGKYKTEQFNPQINQWIENPALGAEIVVDQVHDRQVIKSQKGGSSGRFSFTSAESATYSICLSTNRTGWFQNERAKIHFDLALGDAAQDESDLQQQDESHQKLSNIAFRVRELNHRIADIRREQAYQRQREAEFRDKSESTNSRVLWWSFFQVVLLSLTAYWQVRHLQGFFTAKKMV
ncbi:hypothetical protein MP228_008124 [Amoeboaphelidium protococcarum]|nr:hypothetical protein MP228_008124 [Amoeboaphelidium protococcarum]